MRDDVVLVDIYEGLKVDLVWVTQADVRDHIKTFDVASSGVYAELNEEGNDLDFYGTRDFIEFLRTGGKLSKWYIDIPTRLPHLQRVKAKGIELEATISNEYGTELLPIPKELMEF